MRIHREGKVFLIVLLICLAILNLIAFLYLNITVGVLILISSVPLFLFFLQFFRNPKRSLTTHDSGVISPADGKVVVIEKVFEDEYLKEECIQVSIFMSPMNVHLNRVPMSGIVEYYKYHPGKYLVAFHPKSSQLNERNTIVLRNSDGRRILLRQIAGAVARRIRFYLQVGEAVEQGQELGFIKFGSRMDLFLPLDADIKVQLGQPVRGGQTLIAELPVKE